MRVLLALKTSVALLMLSSCYVSRLAYEHSALLLKRQKISEAVSDGKVDEKTKAKLKEIQEILEFARQSGFNVGDAYEYFINLERSAVSYVVQGAPPEELKLKTWWFPIVGSVPYLGYYDEKDALKMQKELEDEGLETNVSGVSAYSSLGWFSDPVFTPMLKRSRESLAELIFHELTHRTIWIPDEAQSDANCDLDGDGGKAHAIDQLNFQICQAGVDNPRPITAKALCETKSNDFDVEE